jgi:hypothetical protein
MSFEEYSDCFIWRCNGKHCGGKEVVFAPTDFWGCVAELKSRGWRFYRDEQTNDWSHYCAFCDHKHKQTDWMEQKIHSVKGGGG